MCSDIIIAMPTPMDVGKILPIDWTWSLKILSPCSRKPCIRIRIPWEPFTSGGLMYQAYSGPIMSMDMVISASLYFWYSATFSRNSRVMAGSILCFMP